MPGNQRKESERARDGVARSVGRARSTTAVRDEPLLVLQRSAGNRAVTLVVQRKGRKGKGRFATVAKTPGAVAITDRFVESHMGNEKKARDIATRRGLPVSHTIDIRELGALAGEMRVRQQQGYYVPANQVTNPNGNRNQYLTAKEYHIHETRTDKKGRLKPTDLIRSAFYYDAPAALGNACHHFDGLA